MRHPSGLTAGELHLLRLPPPFLCAGDDDVIWFLPAVRQLVRNYDPELPHAISGEGKGGLCQL